MRKPGPLTYLFGNPAILLAGVGGTGLFGYQWWSNDGSLLPAIIAFLVMCQSMNATAQLQKYNDWKREWDAMEGKSSAGARRIHLGWTPLTRFMVGVPAWGIGAYGMLTVRMGDDFFASMAKAAFWSGSALGVGVLIYRAVELGRKPRKQNAAERSLINSYVSVCIGVPTSSPPVSEARKQLPTYCAPLLLTTTRSPES